MYSVQELDGNDSLIQNPYLFVETHLRMNILRNYSIIIEKSWSWAEEGRIFVALFCVTKRDLDY
jgi:hypothetical protein